MSVLVSVCSVKWSSLFVLFFFGGGGGGGDRLKSIAHNSVESDAFY